MKQLACLLSSATLVVSLGVTSEPRHSGEVDDAVIAKQRLNLKKNTKGKGFGPQSPRNIDSALGSNQVVFGAAPAYSEMHLCNIHFHKYAEHAGGQYSKYAGNGDGNGYETGYVYSGNLTQNETLPVSREICPGKHGSLQAGDTIEVHYVHSSAQVKPGPTLGACLSDSINNPQLRVEAQVFVLVNDGGAENFMTLTEHGKENNFYHAKNIPDNTGTPIVYSGSTTGPGYNEEGSPFQVTWSVRPNVAKVNIDTVGKWCEKNVFNENQAHGVRNLVINTELLSPIEQ